MLYQGWKVTIAGAGINFLVGINYTWSIYAAGLVDQMGWDFTQASLPYSLFLICYALCMVPAGLAQDLMGPRPIISLGSVFAGGAFISSMFFFDLPLIAAVLWGLLLGIGLACCFASTTPAAIKWFPSEQKGRVTGIVVTSTGLAALIMSPIIQKVVEIGIDKAFLVSGIVIAAGIIILGQFVVNPTFQNQSRQDTQRSQRPRAIAFLDLRILYFWVMFFLTTGTGVTISAHLVNIMQVQANYEQGYLAVSLFALCNATGRFIGGLLSDLIGRVQSLIVVFIAIATMLVFTIIVSNPIQLMAAVAVLALAFGSLFSIFPSTAAKFFGEANFGFNYGIIFTGLGAAGIFPYLGGVLFELQGHYISTYGLLLGTTLIALLFALKLRGGQFDEK